MSERHNIMTDAQPIFLCGYPKSGTTLLLSLLDSHPDLLVFPEESHFLAMVTNRPKEANLTYFLSRTGIRFFGQAFQVPSGYRDYSKIDAETYKSQVTTRWNQSAQRPPDVLESLVFSYGESIGQKNYKYWVEKTPHNERYLMTALDWWPKLRAVCILRDPRDNYASYRIKRKRDKKPFGIEKFVFEWTQNVRYWESFVEKYPNQGLLIRYDDLVQRPRETLQNICDFLDIHWCDVLLRPSRNNTLWKGNSMYDAKFTGISSASVGKYKETLTINSTGFLERWLSHIMERYHWEAVHKMPLWLAWFTMAYRVPVGILARAQVTKKLRRAFTKIQEMRMD